MNYMLYFLPDSAPFFGRTIRIMSPYLSTVNLTEDDDMSDISGNDFSFDTYVKFNGTNHMFSFSFDLQNNRLNLDLKESINGMFTTVSRVYYAINSQEDRLFQFIFNCQKMLIKARKSGPNNNKKILKRIHFSSNDLPYDSISLEPLKYNSTYFQVNNNNGSIYSYESLSNWFQEKCTDPNTNKPVFIIRNILIKP